MTQPPPGFAAPSAQPDDDSALGEAVRTSIESWLDGENPQNGGPVTFFEHARWGTVVVRVDPSSRMLIEATARHRARTRAMRAAEQAAPARTVSLPSAAEMQSLVRARLVELGADPSLTPDERVLAAMKYLRADLAARLEVQP